MTPKEKAKDLQTKFRTLDLTINDDTFVTRKAAKQYALLCVSEILDLGYEPGDKGSFRVYNYYCKVKIELNKL